MNFGIISGAHRKSISLVLLTLLLLPLWSCSSDAERARRAVEQYLQNQGITDMTVDLFHEDARFPDRAYIAVTVTHSFATGEGKPQKENLGYILKQNGQDWTVERNTNYTKEQNRASDLLAGKK